MALASSQPVHSKAVVKRGIPKVADEDGVLDVDEPDPGFDDPDEVCPGRTRSAELVALIAKARLLLEQR